MRHIAAAALIFVAVAAPAEASVFSLTYNGASTFGFGPASGAGSLSTDVTGAVTLADLTSFTFSLTAGLPGKTDHFTFGLSDISSFSGDIANGAWTDLQFETKVLPGYYTPNTQFVVLDLGPDGALTANPDSPPLTRGALTVAAAGQPTPVPEPGLLALLGVGLFGAGALTRRRKS